MCLSLFHNKSHPDCVNIISNYSGKQTSKHCSVKAALHGCVILAEYKTVAFRYDLYLFERRDERAKGDDSRVCEQLSNFCHSPDVLFPVFRSKAQVLVETSPDIVTVQAVGGDTTRHKVLFQGKCNLQKNTIA